jgi:hypothetical protein
MATLVAHLNAQPVSTRFRIRLVTVWAVQGMREPTGINCPQARVELPPLNWHI